MRKTLSVLPALVLSFAKLIDPVHLNFLVAFQNVWGKLQLLEMDPALDTRPAVGLQVVQGEVQVVQPQVTFGEEPGPLQVVRVYLVPLQVPHRVDGPEIKVFNPFEPFGAPSDGVDFFRRTEVFGILSVQFGLRIQFDEFARVFSSNRIRGVEVGVRGARGVAQHLVEVFLAAVVEVVSLPEDADVHLALLVPPGLPRLETGWARGFGVFGVCLVARSPFVFHWGPGRSFIFVVDEHCIVGDKKVGVVGNPLF